VSGAVVAIAKEPHPGAHEVLLEYGSKVVSLLDVLLPRLPEASAPAKELAVNLRYGNTRARWGQCL
jgi:hypothetical protein